MSPLRSSAPALFLLLATGGLVPGCAQGGGNLLDAGPPPPPPTDAAVDGGPVGVDAGPMMDVDAGPMMMGTDAGPMGGTDAGPMGTDAGVDAGFDAGPPVGCTSASECADGLACNGVERCVGGTCMPGTAFTCDDAISCTRDTCVEGASPSCNFVADNSLCPAGQTCGGSGCMATCADTPCRLVGPQCGCPGAQGCYLSGGSRLCTTAGTTPIGSTCSGLFSCVPGGVCLNVGGPTSPSQCNRFCNTDSDCGGGICFYTLDDGAGGTVPGVTVCTTPCNPDARTGCPSGTACSLFRESMGAMRYFTECLGPVGTAGQFGACTVQEDCQAGFGCLGGECLEWCSLPGGTGAAAGCAAGLRCYGFTTPATIGGTTYGVCDL